MSALDSHQTFSNKDTMYVCALQSKQDDISHASSYMASDSLYGKKCQSRKIIVLAERTGCIVSRGLGTD